MAMVIRVLVYQGEEKHLKSWLELSLSDGPSEMLPGLTVRTIHSDVECEKFGDKRPPILWEGETVDIEAVRRQTLLRWALLQAVADDKNIDSFHLAHKLVVDGYLSELPTQEDLDAIAAEAKSHLKPSMGNPDA